MTEPGIGRISTPFRDSLDSLLPRFETPLVPRNSISGRALVAVVAIMTFLASLTTGAAVLVSKAAGEWQSDIAREVTIQIIPAPGRDLDAAVDKAAAVARAFTGIVDVRPYSKEESTKLLEPWLGSGLSLDELPVPRLIVVKIAPDATPDIAQLRRMLAEQVPGAALDDHRGWIDRMRSDGRHGRRRRHLHFDSDVRRHHVVGHLCDPRRDGDQQGGDRSPAFCRRQKRLHRRAFSAPFSDARPARRRHWRRRRDRAVCARQRDSAGGLPARRAGNRRRLCSVHSRSASLAMSPCSAKSY